MCRRLCRRLLYWLRGSYNWIWCWGESKLLSVITRQPVLGGKGRGVRDVRLGFGRFCLSWLLCRLLLLLLRSLIHLLRLTSRLLRLILLRFLLWILGLWICTLSPFSHHSWSSRWLLILIFKLLSFIMELVFRLIQSF